MELLQPLKLGVLLRQVIVEHSALAGQVPLREHVVLHAELEDLEGFEAVGRHFAALRLLLKVNEGNLLQVRPDVVSEVRRIAQDLGCAVALLERRRRHAERKLFVGLVEIEKVLVLGAKETDLIPVEAGALVPLERKDLAVGVDVRVFVVDSELSVLHFSFRVVAHRHWLRRHLDFTYAHIFKFKFVYSLSYNYRTD